MMDVWNIVTLLIGFFCTILGWIARTLFMAVYNLREQVANLERGLPNMYARRDDVRDMFMELKELISELKQDIKDDHKSG